MRSTSPSFVASLIQGTFQAIVDASIQQMEAYAELLKNVAKTVDQFMNDNITDGLAKDHLADEHRDVFAQGHFERRSEARPCEQDAGELPSFFQDLGFTARRSSTTRRSRTSSCRPRAATLAEQRQQTLATMVLMGINRVVVDDGEIIAKLMFHIDAAETSQLKFDQNEGEQRER